MEEYHSPFLLPEQEKPEKPPKKPPECSNPGDAWQYPDMHAKAGSPGANPVWGRACPVHKRRAEEPTGEPADPWQQWFTYREAYATTDGEEGEAARQEFMSKMLGTVTAANPPDVPFKRPKPVKTKTWHASALCAAVFWAVWIPTFAGILSVFLYLVFTLFI